MPGTGPLPGGSLTHAGRLLSLQPRGVGRARPARRPIQLPVMETAHPWGPGMPGEPPPARRCPATRSPGDRGSGWSRVCIISSWDNAGSEEPGTESDAQPAPRLLHTGPGGRELVRTSCARQPSPCPAARAGPLCEFSVHPHKYPMSKRPISQMGTLRLTRTRPLSRGVMERPAQRGWLHGWPSARSPLGCQPGAWTGGVWPVSSPVSTRPASRHLSPGTSGALPSGLPASGQGQK